MIRRSVLFRAGGTLVAGTVGFLVAYRSIGISCYQSFSGIPPSCANSFGRLFAPVSDFRPTWLAAAMAALAAAWLFHLATWTARGPVDRIPTMAAGAVAAGLPLWLQWQGAGAAATLAALGMTAAFVPVALGFGLSRTRPLDGRDMLVGAITVAGAMVTATVVVLWATHRFWGWVATPHVWMGAVALLPELGLAVLLMRSGSALRSRLGLASGDAVPADSPAPVAAGSLEA